MILNYSPEIRMVCLLLLHHPSQRGRTFAERKTRMEAFERLQISKGSTRIEKTEEGFRVELIGETYPTVTLTPQIADLLTRAIDEVAARPEVNLDESALYDLERQLQSFVEPDSLVG